MSELCSCVLSEVIDFIKALIHFYTIGLTSHQITERSCCLYIVLSFSQAIETTRALQKLHFQYNHIQCVPFTSTQCPVVRGKHWICMGEYESNEGLMPPLKNNILIRMHWALFVLGKMAWNNYLGTIKITVSLIAMAAGLQNLKTCFTFLSLMSSRSRSFFFFFQFLFFFCATSRLWCISSLHAGLVSVTCPL